MNTRENNDHGEKQKIIMIMIINNNYKNIRNGNGHDQQLYEH
jgi:hypothetical protein